MSNFERVTFVIMKTSNNTNPLYFISTNNIISSHVHSRTSTHNLTLPSRILGFDFNTFFKIGFMTCQLVTHPPLHTLSTFLQQQSLCMTSTFKSRRFTTFTNSKFPVNLRRNRSRITTMSHKVRAFPTALRISTHRT